MTKVLRKILGEDFETMWAAAHKAGMAAAKRLTPTPMVVTERAVPFDDNSPIKRQWHVPDGVCGFAWVVVRPGTSAFARWAKKHKDARRNYYGGMTVKWVGEFNQSYEKKFAYARAFAEVLREAGINATPGGRLD